MKQDPEISPKERDCMAPDTEPTDEELAVVTREAGAVARERKQVGEAWLARTLAAALVVAMHESVAL